MAALRFPVQGTITVQGEAGEPVCWMKFVIPDNEVLILSRIIFNKDMVEGEVDNKRFHLDATKETNN